MGAVSERFNERPLKDESRAEFSAADVTRKAGDTVRCMDDAAVDSCERYSA